MKFKKTTLSIATALLLSSNIMADELSDLKAEIFEIREQTQALIDESADMQTGFSYTTVDVDKSHSGLGPAASKVYYSKNPLSIGGYGEMYFSSQSDDNGYIASETQVKRLITYFGYKFSDDIILNTEIEYEGGGVTASGDGDEVVVEFMYIDFMKNKNFNLRVGNFLIPMGLINQQHEPTLFTTVQRPKTAYYIIPSTWGESGAMAYGEIIDGIEYRLALTSALQPDDAGGDKWLRKGRGGSFEVLNPQPATIIRIDYTRLNGLLIGASMYNDSNLQIYDAHIDAKYAGARIYGTYAQTYRTGTTVGSTQVTKSNGAFVNLSYDILLSVNSIYKLPVFVQYETYNPQAKLTNGTTGDDTNNITIGMNFFPHEQIVLKADYVLSEKAGIKSNITSVSMGFIF